MAMVKIEVNEASGAALDWLVAKCQGTYMPHRLVEEQLTAWFLSHWTAKQGGFNYSANWAHGGPIIDRELIGIFPCNNGEMWGAERRKHGEHWIDTTLFDCDAQGPTALIAGLRAYVAGKLGEEADVPEELL